MDRNLVEAKRAQVESIVQNLLTQVSAWTKVVSCGEHDRCIYVTQLHAITSVYTDEVSTYLYDHVSTYCLPEEGSAKEVVGNPTNTTRIDRTALVTPPTRHTSTQHAALMIISAIGTYWRCESAMLLISQG